MVEHLRQEHEGHRKHHLEARILIAMEKEQKKFKKLKSVGQVSRLTINFCAGEANFKRKMLIQTKDEQLNSSALT